MIAPIFDIVYRALGTVSEALQVICTCLFSGDDASVLTQ